MVINVKSKITLPINTLPLWVLVIVLLPVSLNILVWTLETFMTNFENTFSTADVNPQNLSLGISIYNIAQSILFLISIGITLWILTIIKASHITKWYVEIAEQYKLKAKGIGESIQSLTRWKIHRWVKIGLPLFCTFLLILSLIFFWINSFNVIAGIAGKNLEFVISLAMFTALSSMFILFLASIYTIWIIITSCYGNIISVVDPQLDTSMIQARSKKLSFALGNSTMTYFLYVGFIVFVILQVLLYLYHGLAGTPINYLLVLTVELIDLFCFIMFYGRLTKNYYRSVLIYLKKISCHNR